MAASCQLLGGRLAVVTGGGSGIGRAACVALAREGAKVVVADINENAAKATLKSLPGDGSGHHAQGVDVVNLEAVNGLFHSIQSIFSRVPDIVVNCAGITRDCFMVDMTEKMFDDVLNVNLKGTFLVVQAASKLMIKEKISNGSVISISSVVGKVGNIGQCNYAASKAGVEGFTKTIAKELARHGIRCNAIMPGFIDTPMVAAVPDKVIEMVKKQIPLGRMGKPEEIADACVFLASDKSSYITGSTIQVSGGLYL